MFGKILGGVAGALTGKRTGGNTGVTGGMGPGAGGPMQKAGGMLQGKSTFSGMAGKMASVVGKRRTPSGGRGFAGKRY